MKDKVIISVQGDLYGAPIKPDVERSQVRLQENAQSSESWKQCDQEEVANSSFTRRFVRAATPRTEFQNTKYTNHQYMTKIFYFSAEEVGNYRSILNVLKGSIEDKMS